MILPTKFIEEQDTLLRVGIDLLGILDKERKIRSRMRATKLEMQITKERR